MHILIYSTSQIFNLQPISVKRSLQLFIHEGNHLSFERKF